MDCGDPRRKLIREMGYAMSRAPGLHELYMLASRYCAQLVPAERSSLALIADDPAQVFDVFALDGLDAIPVGTQLPLDGTSVGEAVRTETLVHQAVLGQAMHLADVRLLHSLGMCCLVNVPLFAGGRVVGTLNSASAQPGRYTPSDLDVLEQIGLVLACNVDSRRSLGRVEHALEEARTILDNVPEGLALLDAQGRIQSSVSRQLQTWLGEAPVGAPVATWLGALDPVVGEAVEVAFEDLNEAVLPAAVVLRQLPRRLRVGDRTLEFELRPVMVGPRVERVVFIVVDLTDRLARERAETVEREVRDGFRHLVRDRAGFLRFMDETDRWVHRVQETGDRFLLHTLKGNAATFGAQSVAGAAHDAETLLDAGRPPAEAIEQLACRWSAYRGRLNVLTGVQSRGAIELDPREYTDFLDLVRREGNRVLVQTVESWQWERIGPRVQQLEEAARRVAERVGKPAPRWKGAVEALRVNGEILGPLLSSLVHLARNAMVHGIEAPEQRLAAGKPEAGTLIVDVGLERGRLRISFADDGAGVDWDALRPHGDSRSDLELLLAAGSSARPEADQEGGRGLGLAAVAAELETLGGRLAVTSDAGRGTRFELSLPGGSAWVRRVER